MSGAGTDRDVTDGAAFDPPPALELIDVVKEYPGTPPVRALDGVNLRIDSGEMVAIVGQSGSGKSTLLHVAGTLDRPTSGRLLISGVDTTSLGDDQLAAVRSQHLGFVFQQFFLLDELTAAENVAMGLVYRGVAPATRVHRAREVLDRVGLAHRSHHLPKELSGGERQRVAIARALVTDPSLLLADEPTGNLDSASSHSILDLMENLHADGVTVAIITHDTEVAERAPRKISVADGRIASDSAVAEHTDVPVTVQF